MALMSAESSVITPDDKVEKQPIAYLAEGADPEQENMELGGVVEHVTSSFRKSKDGRSTDEERWLLAYRNYRGLYGPDVQFTDTEKSKAFVKITKTKVLAAYAQLVDVLFAGGKFPVGIEAPTFPQGVAGEVHYDPEQITTEKVKEKTGQDYEVPRNYLRPDIEKELGVYQDQLAPVEEELTSGTGTSPTAITFEPAKKAAANMEKLMHDQLEESDAGKHLRAVAFEMSLLGTGVLKGPFAIDREYPRWDEEGNYDPEMKTIPNVEAVSVWDVYPDPSARNMTEAEFMIQRHRLNRPQIRALKNRPHFRDESIEIAISMGPNYQQEHWEHALGDNATDNQMDRFEVLEYWGIMDSEVAEDAGIRIPKNLRDEAELQVNVWVCNNQILRLVLNPFTPRRIPFHAVPYETNPYGFFGIGVGENMEDTQLLMNGFIRMAVDNAALSGNLLIEIDETNLVPGQDMSIYPGKAFRRQSGAPGQAIFGTKFPNVSQELVMMFDKARQLADEATGMPSYAHGQAGVTGIGRTASGMSMLMGAAAQNIKAVVRNIDDYLLAPLGKALFAFNMQFNFDPQFIGSLSVKARGTESLMRNEVRSQRLLQFMQMTANPVMQPFIRYDYILRELAASMDLDEDKILNDPREAVIQAKMMAEIQALMPAPPPGAAPAGPEGPSAQGTAQGPAQGGNVAPGAAPGPDQQGFSGSGGGANGGNPPSAAGPAAPAPIQ